MPSKIIKGGEPVEARSEQAAARPSRAMVDSEVYNAHVKAREIFARAEKQAAQLLEKTEKQAADLLEKTQQRAVEALEHANQQRDAIIAEAREAGRQEGLAQVTELLLKAKTEAGALVTGAEREIVKLALAMAEKIIGRALETNPETILHVAAQAIESFRQQRELVLRVNPQDVELLRNSRKRLMEMLCRTKDIQVREDPEVSSGGCIIETEVGTVDAQLRTQLQMLEQALLGDEK